MTTQSEQTLENNLIAQLVDMGYERVAVDDEASMVVNLRTQLEAHNETSFSDSEFDRILNHLNKGGVFERAKTIRDKMSLARDNGTHKNIEFLNMAHWCQNRFQVTQQVRQDGAYQNRYDVTILINGLPLVQIELKRRGIELKEAFNQVNRYRRHSYNAGQYGLFQFVQLFVISNGVNTKYYSNTIAHSGSHKESFKFTSFWAGKDNAKITDLEDFTRKFLEKCHLAKMITKYMVLTTSKTLLALRPYQFHAVEAMVDKVNNEAGGGYIWHTTGSGKTLTSFKASQIIVENPKVNKVVFVVDRNDLDNQTIREFNSFREGSVDATDNTAQLVRQFNNPDTKLIVTTIQKLNNAVTRERHALKMDRLKDERFVFIFDECHRSQFGETHQRITEYFTNHQLFGFTGTPIFADNAHGSGANKRTTKDLFGECLHKYVITDAIRDENVLKFSVEYYKGFRLRNGALDTDIDVEAIDTREAFEDPRRIEAITDFVIKNHDRKTHSRDFTAMMAISNVETLTKYYEAFRRKKQAGEHNLRIATIFSYGANEEDKDADSLLDDVRLDAPERVNQHSRDKLESYIADYNEMFGTSYNTRDTGSFYNYYRNIADRVKSREIDLLLVVNMFLTGFDSKTLNTLYVDKNLRFHGLIQAYSRTNRILNETKSQGNVVVFRNLKKATDQALELFANKDAKEDVFIAPYEEYVTQFNDAVEQLRLIAPEPKAVDYLPDEDSEKSFVEAFRTVLRLRNVLDSFAEYQASDVVIDDQTFENFKGKYLDLYDKVVSNRTKEKVSILDDIDFELELTRRDEVNVSYILRLIARMVGADESKQAEIRKSISDTMAGVPELRSKRELIEQFIDGTLPTVTESDDVENAFAEFVNEAQVKEFRKMCQDEGLDAEKTQALLDRYVSTGRIPRNHDLGAVLVEQPSILQRESILERVKNRLTGFIQAFIDGM